MSRGRLGVSSWVYARATSLEIKVVYILILYERFWFSKSRRTTCPICLTVGRTMWEGPDGREVPSGTGRGPFPGQSVSLTTMLFRKPVSL